MSMMSALKAWSYSPITKESRETVSKCSGSEEGSLGEAEGEGEGGRGPSRGVGEEEMLENREERRRDIPRGGEKMLRPSSSWLMPSTMAALWAAAGSRNRLWFMAMQVHANVCGVMEVRGQ